jgi:hypothetical protein
MSTTSIKRTMWAMGRAVGRPAVSQAVPSPIGAAIDEANAGHRHEAWYALRDAMRELRALGLVAPSERVEAALRVVERRTTLQPYTTMLLAFADRLVVVRQLERMRELEQVNGRPLGGEIDVTILPLTELEDVRVRRPFLGAANVLVLGTHTGRTWAWTLPEEQSGAGLEHFLQVVHPQPAATHGTRTYLSWIPAPRRPRRAA